MAFALLAAAPALAAGQTTLTGDWGGTRARLVDDGVALRADITGFYQGGIGDVAGTEWDASGRFDVFADLDFGKMGAVQGLGFHFHGETRFGDPRGSFGGELWPSNTGAVLPLGGADRFVASSLYFTQATSKRSVLMLGKINMIDVLASDPFYGGWGTQRFLNVAFVAPPSGVVPPTIMGAIWVYKGSPISVTLMAFDADDRTNDYFPGDLFSNGVNLSVGFTWGGNIAGRASSIGLTSTVSTARGINFENILLPPDLATSTRKGSYNIAVSFSHLLVESRTSKGKGLGIYLKAAIADGNPNVIQSSAVGGIGGEALISGRPGDAFAIGGFWYNFSDVLQDTLDPAFHFRDEAGIEAWYRFQLTPWLALTADAQVIDPASGDRPTFLLGAIRGNLKF